MDATVQPKPAKRPAAAPVKRTSTIRKANPRDLSALYDCLVHYFDECSMLYPGVHEAAGCTRLLHAINAGGVILAELDGQIIGATAVEIGKYDWNPDVKFLNMPFLFVLPKYRTAGTAKRLVSALKEIAVLHKTHLHASLFWKHFPDLLDEFMKRQGFEYVGGTFVFIPEKV